MQRPDVIVYLDVTPEESLRRIKLRQRECESGVTLEYLTSLHAAYDEFLRAVRGAGWDVLGWDVRWAGCVGPRACSICDSR